MRSVLDQTNRPQADMTDQVEAYYQDFEPTNFALTPYCCAFIMEAANTNVIVVEFNQGLDLLLMHSRQAG